MLHLDYGRQLNPQPDPRIQVQAIRYFDPP